MTFQTFLTLLLVGTLVGLVMTLAGKGKRAGLLVNLVVGAAGSFLGWFVYHHINRIVIELLFAIGASILLLRLVGLVKK